MNASIASADKHAHLGAITSMESGAGLAVAEEFDATANSADLTEAVFAGVPTLVKDLGGPFRGWPVRASSKALSNSDGEMDSDFAILFRKTGVCIFGMTSVPEFGLSLSTEPATGLPCRNPLAPHLTAGGSSGGAAAAVAQGIVAIAHATDAGGSIRVPAACCGLVGLKPSRGAISGGPHFSNHIGGLASELAVCRSVRDCAATFNAVSGHSLGSNSGDFEAFDLSGIRIGTIVDTGPDYEICDMRSAVLSKASDCLVAEGAHRIDFDWSDIAPLAEESAKAFATIICANLANMFEEKELDPAKTELITQAALERGFSMSASDLISAQHSLVSVAHSLSHIFEKVDCILVPMLASAPKPIGSLPTNHSDLDAHFERMTAFAPTATLANVSGFPAITLPFGEDDDGLPLPVQMIARPGDEKLLLSLASYLEAQQKWVHRFPVAGLPQ